MWTTDPFWTETLLWMTRLSPSHRYILTPDDWIGADSRYMPVDYGVALDAERCTAFAIPKDDVDRLPAWLLQAEFAGARCVFANDVFVVYSSVPEDWEKADAASIEQHLPYFLHRHQEVLAGALFRKAAVNPRFPFSADERAPVLIVNASHMGNFGDELLAGGAVRLMGQIFPGCDSWVVRPDFVIPVGVRPKAIVLGGGGFLYDHLASPKAFRSQLPNITNYFKFGYIARTMGVPFIAFGLGSQNAFASLTSIDATHYVRESLRDALAVTTRDARSANELSSLLVPWGPRVLSLPDLAFEIATTKFTPLSLGEKKRIAIVGEVAGFQGAFEAIAQLVAKGTHEFHFIAQAIEDPSHADQLQHRVFPVEIPVKNLGDVSIQDGLEFICSFDGLITTRFHALVVAVANGIPAVALDNPTGKKTRLIEEFDLKSDGHYEIVTAEQDVGDAIAAITRLTTKPRKEARKFSQNYSDVIEYLTKKLNP